MPCNQSRPDDCDVVDLVAPDQAVVPVVVPEILVFLPGPIRLCRIIAAGGCRLDSRAGFQVERHEAFQADGVARVSAGRDAHCAAASVGCRRDRRVHGWRVERLAVADCAERPHVEQRRHIGLRSPPKARVAGDGEAGKFQKVPAAGPVIKHVAREA